MEKLDAEVLIAGAGPAGATLAGLLGSKGVECIVIDAAARRPLAQHPDPRVLAVTRASANILGDFGLWERLPAERLGNFRRMLVWDANGKGRIGFDSEDLGQSTLGYIVEQQLLQKVLDDTMDFFPAIDVYRNESAHALEWDEDGVRVFRQNGTPLRARLVVAADGFNSGTRDLAGIDYYIHDYRQSAVACVVTTELPHEDVARQRFLSEGPLAFLPMADMNRCAVIWSTLPEKARDLAAMAAPDFNLVLQDAFEDTLGEIVESGPRAVFPLKRARAACYCRDRFALIGDAAHSIHPLAGQGANLGLLDAACLAQTLLHARRAGKDIGNRCVLRKYERWRRGENEMMMAVMDGFKYFFEKQDDPLPMVRNAGLNLVDGLGPVKHWIMRRAMGLTGDLPDAARA